MTAAFLENKLPDALDLLRQMVSINSFTVNKEGVNRLARFTADAFAALGFSAEFVPARNPEFGNHLVLTRQGKSDRNIAMISHLDTVFSPQEEQRNNFHWQPEGDRLFGPGTQDIKGGSVGMWLVMQALQAQVRETFETVTWKLIWNAAEERFSPDFGDLCRGQFDKNTLGALIYEAEGRLGDEHLLVLARKGRASWRVTVSGRGAHAGGKHASGANAIVQLGRIVDRIAALTDYSRQLTFNVGRIEGGTVLNRVPHEAVAEGEFRTFDPKVYASAISALKGLEGEGDVKSPTDGFRCKVKIEILTESRPWPRNPGTDGLFKFWQTAGEELGLPTSYEERGGLSDGNLIWDAVPTLDGLGSFGDNDHCSERSADGSKVPEYLEKSRIVPKAILNTMAVLSLAKS